MTSKISIKNVQARIEYELYENIQQIIANLNDKHEADEEKLNIQKVVVEALNDWVRKHGKDSFLSLSGLLNKDKDN